MRRLLYVDSNIFIYPVIYDSDVVPEAAKAKAKLHEIASGSAKAFTSTLTWDEITWVTRRLFGSEKAAVQGASFLKIPNLKLLKVDIEVVCCAQTLLEEHRLKPRDAIHAATAIRNGISKILSYDEDFDILPNLVRVSP
ncbi:type II toxin-antitoxin system VapC family toxin [Candidatus Bathyarchaeota archaeon]|nr:type II toxin-antitoxin system VapC family toxin [Candidatus Bathyarchaeota archaeon]